MVDRIAFLHCCWACHTTRITIPPITHPPFCATGVNCNNTSEEGDDNFISVLESWLEGEFDLQFEEELKCKSACSGKALLHSSASYLNASPPFFDNEDDKDNYVNKDCPPKRVRGKCREGYTLGNLCHSCWCRKFLAPDRDGIEGSRSRTRQMLG